MEIWPGHPIDTCPIWGGDYEAEGWRYPRDGMYLVEDSPRAGGAYELTDDAEGWLSELGEVGKARLTTWIIDQHRQGVEKPRVTTEVVEHARSRRPLPVHKQAEGMLHFVADRSKSVGSPVDMQAQTGNYHTIHAACAWSESINYDDVHYFLNDLTLKGLLQRSPSGARYTVTVDGYSRIADQATNTDSSQAFVAMWFGDEMDDAYEQGIRERYRNSRIYTDEDRPVNQNVNKIDDEIIAEIRRSRFLVADFTHGEDGARGGVYYEAGFAYGLGLDVIYSCRKDMVDQLHFDTRQYYHIVWEAPEELRDGLAHRIEALIGAGPNK